MLMVLREAFTQVGIGLAMGIPGSIALGFVARNRLFGIQPWDPMILSVATLVLGVSALIAAVIPARRAAKLDPMVALRRE